jgi:hypothetical protein
MFNARALGAESLVLEGDDWRSRLRAWAVIQRDMLDRHPWITQLPMPAPPLAPNSLHFVERGLQAMDGTGLAGTEKLRIIGLLTSYTLTEARMANDAVRAAAAAAKAAESAAASGDAYEPPLMFEEVLRELVDERTYPRLYRIAWSSGQAGPQVEREEFLAGIDLILDGVQARIDRAGGGY